MSEVPVDIRAAAELELRRRKAAKLGVERLAGVIVMPAWDDPPPPPDDLAEDVGFTAATAAQERRGSARAALAAMLADRKKGG